MRSRIRSARATGASPSSEGAARVMRRPSGSASSCVTRPVNTTAWRGNAGQAGARAVARQASAQPAPASAAHKHPARSTGQRRRPTARHTGSAATPADQASAGSAPHSKYARMPPAMNTGSHSTNRPRWAVKKASNRLTAAEGRSVRTAICGISVQRQSPPEAIFGGLQRKCNERSWRPRIDARGGPKHRRPDDSNPLGREDIHLRSGAATHSRYGGMWIDRDDWDTECGRRQEAGQIKREDAVKLARFASDGYLILPQAASLPAIDAFQRAIAAAFRDGNAALLYQAHGSQATRPLDGPVDRLGSRVVDSFVALPQALKLFTSPDLIGFLRVLFDAAPLLFQSLSFDQGSQQGLHQDTAYVVVDRPMELAACWIALEDVRPGSGELIYVPGSHRFADYDFGRGEKHWSGQADDGEVHAVWSRWLIEEAARRNLEVKTFLPRKGDIFLWHADLVHGGAPVQDAQLTRRSLVGHFCPVTARPRYFDHGSRRTTIRRSGPLHYASDHYDLAAATPTPRGSWLHRTAVKFAGRRASATG